MPSASAGCGDAAHGRSATLSVAEGERSSIRVRPPSAPEDSSRVLCIRPRAWRPPKQAETSRVNPHLSRTRRREGAALPSRLRGGKRSPVPRGRPLGARLSRMLAQGLDRVQDRATSGAGWKTGARSWRRSTSSPSPLRRGHGNGYGPERQYQLERIVQKPERAESLVPHSGAIVLGEDRGHERGFCES
jgi:hypothetical protein